MNFNVVVLPLGNSITIGTLGLRIPDLKQNCFTHKSEQKQRLGYGIGRGSMFLFSSDEFQTIYTLDTYDKYFQLSKT